MSDDLDIRGGGAIVVDTGTLRSAAAGFVGLADELRSIARLVGSAQVTLFTDRAGWDAANSAFLLHRRLGEAEEATDDMAGRLTAAAAMYEMAELNAAHAAAVFAGDAEAAASIDLRRAAITAQYPDAGLEAWWRQFEYNLMWPSEMVRQGTEIGEPWSIGGGVIGGAVPYALARGLAALGKGTVDRTDRLRGAPADVRVWAIPASGSGVAGAPSSLAAAAERIPSAGAGDARVRVEKYTMTDGSRQFAVYIAGSKVTADPGELFSVPAAIDLELGNRTPAYDAALAALAAAGAEPGDVVHAFGHSQGGAIVGHLALESEFDVQTAVTLGSPIEADVGAGTLSVALRHTDDPIAMAATGGGFEHPVGSPGSFVAHRVADPTAGVTDIALPAHDVSAYIETAQLLDGSTDPRMGEVRRLFGELGEAVSVEVAEYGAAKR